MNERIDNLRLDAGISRLKDDPRLVVIDREGNVIDPLIGLEKFAELIVRECVKVMYDNAIERKVGLDIDKRPTYYAAAILEHFGAKE